MCYRLHSTDSGWLMLVFIFPRTLGKLNDGWPCKLWSMSLQQATRVKDLSKNSSWQGRHGVRTWLQSSSSCYAAVFTPEGQAAEALPASYSRSLHLHLHFWFDLMKLSRITMDDCRT
jgi:hypothetical protein